MTLISINSIDLVVVVVVVVLLLLLLLLVLLILVFVLVHLVPLHRRLLFLVRHALQSSADPHLLIELLPVTSVS